MAPSKRMSADDKKKIILDIYHKTKQAFTEKEIVALAAKAGVNANTIIDMNQSLIDDSLVEKDKFFGTNYFWSFPAKKDRQMEIQHEETLKSIELLQTQIAEAQVKCMDAKRGREDDGDERAQKLTRLTELAHERKKAEDELESLKENDPQALADLEQELKLVTQAANRWTDNIFNCKTFLTKKRGLDNKEACRILGITSDFDYPEDKIPK